MTDRNCRVCDGRGFWMVSRDPDEVEYCECDKEPTDEGTKA